MSEQSELVCEHCGRWLAACVESPCEQALLRQGIAAEYFQPDPSPYTLASMQPDQCRPVEIHGQIVRVRGEREMNATDRAMLARVIAAAKLAFATDDAAGEEYACTCGTCEAIRDDRKRRDNGVKPDHDHPH